MYNNTIIKGDGEIPNTEHYILKIKDNGDVLNNLIPNQITGKKNSKVFLINDKRGMLFNHDSKKYTLEIINL